MRVKIQIKDVFYSIEIKRRDYLYRAELINFHQLICLNNLYYGPHNLYIFMSAHRFKQNIRSN
jgi:hypothetical protein